MKKVVLLLSTYPFTRPLHGGQIRLSNIARMYSDIGCNVISVAFFDPNSVSSGETGEFDIPVNLEGKYSMFDGECVPLINDYLTDAFAASDTGGFSKIQKVLADFGEPAIVHVEQPWLWSLAKRIRQDACKTDPILIYGSQNVEADLKFDILKQYEVQSAEQVREAIHKLEKSACEEADLSIAVTRSEMTTLAKYGAKKVILAPNGYDAKIPRKEHKEKWANQLPNAPYLVYAASAHPPNFSHFTELVGESLGCFSPESKLVIVGSVCNHIYNALVATRWHSLNLSRIVLAGTVSDDDLTAIKSMSHGFLLPIPHGGGSNLKTAEAIASGKYIIGTPHAFRGFEEYLDLPNITVANTPKQFQSGISHVLGRPPLESSEDSSSGPKYRLGWSSCLSEFSAQVSDLLKERDQ